MSRDDPNFGGNPGRMNSGGFNSTTAGGYNGPGDRSGTDTRGYAQNRGFAAPGAGVAGQQYNENLMRAIRDAGYFTGGPRSGPMQRAPQRVIPTAGPPPGTPPAKPRSWAWGQSIQDYLAEMGAWHKAMNGLPGGYNWQGFGSAFGGMPGDQMDFPGWQTMPGDPGTYPGQRADPPGFQTAYRQPGNAMNYSPNLGFGGR